MPEAQDAAGRNLEAIVVCGDEIVFDERWSVVFDDRHSPWPARVRESILSIGNGLLGTRGVAEDDDEGRAFVVVAGVYDEWRDNPSLLQGPNWTTLVMRRWAGSHDRRVLDLRTGVLVLERSGNGRTVKCLRFISLARPQAAALRAEGPASLVHQGDGLRPTEAVPVWRKGRTGSRQWAWVEDVHGGGIAAASISHQKIVNGTRRVERLAYLVGDPADRPARARATEGLRELEAAGFDRLLAEHRAEWAQRWAHTEVCIDGDPDSELGVRLALFHLFSSVPDHGEAAVGPRGLTGTAYGGHVMWDADVFVLPAMAGTHPPAARAMLEYRLRRLPAALQAARLHELVDDNAFTNVMARWNLRRAARFVEETRRGAELDEATYWRRIADRLVDGYEPRTKLYEQFAGFWRLHPLIVSELAEVPVVADELLGRDVVRTSQVIKQPDVLMFHHLVPEETSPGSLAANVDFYLPRTAHGSSLSPAICAAALARAGRPEAAHELFTIAARLDLDDLTGTTAGGLHTAAAGGLWQALVQGFMGVRPDAGALCVDPVLPSAWNRVEVRVRYHGAHVRVSADKSDLVVAADAPIRVRIGRHESTIDSGEAHFSRRKGSWIAAGAAYRSQSGECGRR